MRRSQKRQAEEFVKLLGRAHKEIKKALERGDRAAARELLEQCQDGAIELGNMIEEEEGEGFATVPLLENYCEQLYQLHEKVWRRLPVNAGKECNVLKESLFQIKSSIENDIRERLEVVFLPYKVSMWGSLESIWKIADADPICDAYVVPIPYYDKNSDGSFEEMHFEEGFPDYVTVTGYEDYDFKERRPDAIFIQNPYDEFHETVSVHPFYYSKNLKCYTDKLVYIPYFYIKETALVDMQTEKEIAALNTAPGMLNADRVIVPSEDIRQTYIRILTKAAGEESRELWKSKVFANTNADGAII